MAHIDQNRLELENDIRLLALQDFLEIASSAVGHMAVEVAPLEGQFDLVWIPGM
jgi:hypothetical protein